MVFLYTTCTSQVSERGDKNSKSTVQWLENHINFCKMNNIISRIENGWVYNKEWVWYTYTMSMVFIHSEYGMCT